MFLEEGKLNAKVLDFRNESGMFEKDSNVIKGEKEEKRLSVKKYKWFV